MSPICCSQSQQSSFTSLDYSRVSRSSLLCQNFLLILRNLGLFEAAGCSELSRSFVAKSPNPAITWNTHHWGFRRTKLKMRLTIFSTLDIWQNSQVTQPNMLIMDTDFPILDLNLRISELVCSLCSSAACLSMWNSCLNCGSKGVVKQVFRCNSLSW